MLYKTISHCADSLVALRRVRRRTSGERQRDIWDRRRLFRGFHSVRTRSYTSNAPTVAQRHVHTLRHIRSTQDDTHRLTARPSCFKNYFSVLGPTFSCTLGFCSRLFKQSSIIEHHPTSTCLLLHFSPVLSPSRSSASLLIVPMKQLADVTFNYGCISSGAVEAEPSERHSQQRRSCITICCEVIYSPNKAGRRTRNQMGKVISPYPLQKGQLLFNDCVFW